MISDRKQRFKIPYLPFLNEYGYVSDIPNLSYTDQFQLSSRTTLQIVNSSCWRLRKLYVFFPPINQPLLLCFPEPILNSWWFIAQEVSSVVFLICANKRQKNMTSSLKEISSVIYCNYLKKLQNTVNHLIILLSKIIFERIIYNPIDGYRYFSAV